MYSAHGPSGHGDSTCQLNIILLLYSTAIVQYCIAMCSILHHPQSWLTEHVLHAINNAVHSLDCFVSNLGFIMVDRLAGELWESITITIL